MINEKFKGAQIKKEHEIIQKLKKVEHVVQK